MDSRATKALLPEGFKIEESSYYDSTGYKLLRFFELRRYRQVRTKKFLRAATYSWRWVLITKADITWNYYIERELKINIDRLVEQAWFIHELEQEERLIQEKK